MQKPCIYNSHHSGIILHPRPWNATLGSTVTFTCSVVGDGLIWRINGINPDDPALETLQPDVITASTSNPITSTLTLTANTEVTAMIQCVAVSFTTTPAVSDTATLLVQGMYVCTCACQH